MSADLQNPADALEILAQVADRHSDSDSPASQAGNGQQNSNRPSKLVPRSSPKSDDYFHYKPIVDGLIAPDTVYELFAT